MTFLYHAHSGLRYLVLLAALAALIALAYALATGRAGRAARILPAVFTGLLDLQVLLGIGLVMSGDFPDAVVGHLVMMVLAVVAAHGASVLGKRATTEQREQVVRLVGIVLALGLIIGGIMALGRSVLGSGPMSVASHAAPDPATAASVSRGHALLTATRDSLPQHVGNALRCTSCHLNDGRKLDGLPWLGVIARYPQYRSRNDAVSTIEDRINDCFERSLNGTPVPADSRDMRDMVTYMASLPGAASARDGVGTADAALPTMKPLAPDTRRGARLFASTCVACHGDHGQGTTAAPPLWGPESYNIGAGMARVHTAAAFIRHNMPLGNPTLTDQQALDVAAYVNSRPRPDFPGKEHDWPRGDAPPDVPYQLLAADGPAARRTSSR